MFNNIKQNISLIFLREKGEHDKHLRRMEEEMEQQVRSVEERVRKQVYHHSA